MLGVGTEEVNAGAGIAIDGAKIRTPGRWTRREPGSQAEVPPGAVPGPKRRFDVTVPNDSRTLDHFEHARNLVAGSGLAKIGAPTGLIPRPYSLTYLAWLRAVRVFLISHQPYMGEDVHVALKCQ